MKKLLFLLFSGIWILSGCSNEGASSVSEDGVVTIDFAIHVANPANQEPAFYAIVERFQEENPDIKVNLIGSEQADHVRRIKMQSQSNTLPDIFWMLPASAAELAEAGMVMDLSDFLADNPEIQESLKDNMVDAFNTDGVQYGLPFQALVTGIFYNEALFKQYGLEIPETFEEIVEVSKVFAANGVTTIAVGAQDPFSVWSFLTMLSRFGYFDRIDDILAGEDSFNNEEFLRFYKSLDELREAGAFPENVRTLSYFQAVEQFLTGNAAMLNTGIWDAQRIEQSDIADHVGFWWGPTFSDGVGDQQISSVVPSAPLLVSKNVMEDELKLEAVERFLAFYYGEVGTQLMVDNQLAPLTNKVVEVDAEESPVFSRVVEQLQREDWVSQQNQPDLVVPESVANALHDSIFGVINGVFTPEQAVEAVERQIQISLGQ